MTIKWDKLLLCVAIPLVVGTIAGLLSRNSMVLYSSFNKPALAPPAWLFPVVWTLLYTLMGISSYLIIMSLSSDVPKALIIYAIQLILNFIWPLIFFNGQNYILALFILIALWIAVLYMIITFSSINPSAGKLQIPYLLWLTFAFYLNLSVALN